jgi:hypothetical protein
MNLRSNNCKICGKDTGKGGRNRSKLKIGSRYVEKGYVHVLCYERQKRDTQIIKDQNKYPDKSLAMVKIWRKKQNGNGNNKQQQ